MNSDIKVSVCVVTYNQEKYIAECLQSLVDQITDFPFEIIVGEDCSTDKTREIVLEFQNKYPNIIKPLLHMENVGPVKNVIATYKQAKGTYIAHMDGDDLALPGKLQVQADVLDENTDCIICSHDVELLTFNGEFLKRTFRKHEKVKNTIFDLYQRLPFFVHSSKMFKNDLDEKFWEQLHPQALDIEVHAQQAKYGNIYHIDKVFGVYRVGVGVSVNAVASVNPLLVAGNERVFMDALATYNGKTSTLKAYYAKTLMNYAYQSAIFGDKCGYVAYIRKSVSIKLFSAVQAIMFIFSFLPRVAVLISKKRNKIRF
ncbi:glycosyltransferase family 2 protein [Plesiomonas shigelloides]|uniref:Glycosyltransferase family 2 protein n=1 Tax=Plesiomonas shigelloides TaxID=703 RepID=A0A4D6U7U6_PLESH|nr:glycosyltransferase family 2 protein [Plesiomonas shigelloides]KAB7675545.1 glycosyltransferase [Plesiomonas shigelloides]QCH03319.1 glycosyltransferase family 2 protein [Plesiomonas shigelloides]